MDSFTGIHVSTPITQLICGILITFVCGDVLAWNYNPELSPDLSCNPFTIILLSKSPSPYSSYSLDVRTFLETKLG